MASCHFRLPNIEDLTKQQERIRLLPSDGCYLIVGGPGTGKSVIALLRARRHQRRQNTPDYVFLVYNQLLLEASRDLSGKQLQAATWIAWFKARYSEMLGRPCPLLPSGQAFDLDWPAINQAIAEAPSLPAPTTPYLIIDEGQDMPPGFYRALTNLGFVNFFVVADQNQRITDQHSTLREIQSILAIPPERRIELTVNYRNSYPVAHLARAFCPHDPASPPPELPPERRSAPSPLLVDYGPGCRLDFDGVILRLLKAADRNPSQLIGIFTANNATRERYHRRLGELDAHLDHGRPRLLTYRSGAPPDLHFSQGGIRVINGQSAKGLEFHTVFLADIDGHEGALFIPAPLPSAWIKVLLFASAADKAAALDEAADYDNVDLPPGMAKVKATLFKAKPLSWPPSASALISLPPGHDPALHRAWGIGATLALLSAIANHGDASVGACHLAGAPEDIDPASLEPPILPALYRWVTDSPATASDGVQAGMLLATLEAIVDDKQNADDQGRRPDPRLAVLDYLRHEKSRLDNERLRDALGKLDQDLRGIVGFGGDTGGELLARHAKPYSRALILFFLRDDCRGFLTFEHPLLNEMDRIVAAMLFAAATGWRSLPSELRRYSEHDAVSLRMAATEQQSRNTGIDLGPPPPRRRPLREILSPGAKGWNRKQQQAALTLARGLDWNDIIHTRINLGKGEYQLVIDGSGAHILLDGETRAVTTCVDSDELLQRLSTTVVSDKLEVAVRGSSA